MSQHTPGPWTFHSGMVWAGTTADIEGVPIAYMVRTTPYTMPTERDANARLIAQAPRMLTVLTALLKETGQHAIGECPKLYAACQEARALLLEIEG